MFSTGPNYNKLKTNLRLAMSRLKLLQKKKTELTQKARKEIADYIADNKEDRARIRVEHIIREDYVVEAYELLEMYCDLLLARFGLLEQMKTLDEGLEEAVNSLMWSALRIQADVQEFKVISDQLTAKYGKPFAEACRENQLGKVNTKLVQKLSVSAPPKVLVEKYMAEIAKSHGIQFTPDMTILREDEVAAAENMLIDFHNKGKQAYGWALPSPPDGAAGGPPEYPPGDGSSGGGGGMAAPMGGYPGPPPGNPQPFSYPSLKDVEAGGPTAPTATESMFPGGIPDLPEPPSGPFVGGPPPPSYYNGPPADNSRPGAHPFDGPPPPPEGGDDADLDYDDLSKRFEELKKKH